LLFECSLENLVDIIVVATAEQQIRISRLISNRNTSEQEAYQRIGSQMPETEKIEKADIVIYNNGSVDALRIQAQNFIKKVKIRK
jgi:dephospho-CoA kinase